MPRPITILSRPAGAQRVQPASPQTTAIAEEMWCRIERGEDFWSVVHDAFRMRELTRADLAALIDRGLRETLGSYRALLSLFNLPPSDYKRFHAYLYQRKCNLPVLPYRMGVPGRGERKMAPTEKAS